MFHTVNRFVGLVAAACVQGDWSLVAFAFKRMPAPAAAALGQQVSWFLRDNAPATAYAEAAWHLPTPARLAAGAEAVKLFGPLRTPPAPVQIPSKADGQRQRAAALQAHVDAEQAETCRAGFRIWLGAQPSIAGTPAAHYLARRGIALAALGRQPGALRFHPGLWCAEAQAHLPALVTAISRADGAFLALHQVWLQRDGDGWARARLREPAKVLGGFRGGRVQVWRGASGKPLARAAPGETVDVVEGIEDGLVVALATPEARVVAAVSADNMAALTFPPAVTAVKLWRGGDTDPAPLDRAAAAFQRRGLAVMEVRTSVYLPDATRLPQARAG